MLLSIITCGKNDDYSGDFVSRIQLNLSKLESNISQLNTDEIEIIVIDWGSENKLSSVLETNEFKYTKFYHVPENIASKYSPDSNFSYTKSMNTGYRRSLGKFVFFIDGDSYIPLHSLENLYNMVKQRQDPYTFFWASRFHLPYELHFNNPNLEKIDSFITDWSLEKRGWRHEKYSLTNFGGGMMGLLLSKNICEESTCWYEKHNKWGWVDLELNARMSSKYPCNGDLEDHNSYFFHLDHHFIGGKATWGGEKGYNPPQSSPYFRANDENWGLINEQLTS